MLTRTEREFVKDPKKRQRYQKSVRRQYNYRIRQKAKQMMKDVHFLATYLPEDQQEQIFDDGFFLPMVEAVVNPERKDISKDLKKKLKTIFRHKVIFVQNERVFTLCNKLIDIGVQSGIELIPNPIIKAYMMRTSHDEDLQIVRRIGAFFE